MRRVFYERVREAKSGTPVVPPEVVRVRVSLVEIVRYEGIGGVGKMQDTYSSKCFPRLGSARRFAIAFRTLLSGRTTMMGTGE